MVNFLYVFISHFKLQIPRYMYLILYGAIAIAKNGKIRFLNSDHSFFSISDLAAVNDHLNATEQG